MAQAAQAVPAGETDQHAHNKNFWSLVLGSIGVVYGDIGTSPLYAFRESVTAAKEHGTAGQDAIIGILSLIVWSLILIVTLKYVLILLRADNKGEGGTFALMSLGQSVAPHSKVPLFLLAIVGAAFFYGDAVLTPAISVLSAVEGLKLVTPQAEKFVIPIALAVICALFSMQSRGTDKIAKFFGPITLVWFITLGIGGLMHMFDDMRVFQAFNPYLGVKFVFSHGYLGLLVMGLVFLAVTGAEALYADLGHFGRKPIQMAWLTVVLPALLLNYFGQAALLLSDPSVIDNPFYKLYPSWALVPMVILATLATVIASQAVITGAFSITRQAISLGFLPRLEIRHTSETMAGQIYMPKVNMMLFVGVVIVVLLFRNSSNLAAAYGVSVTASMCIDSIMAFFVIWKAWKWPLWKAAGLMVPLLLIEEAFLAANMLKIMEGGWFPIAIAITIVLMMLTWVRGAKMLSRLNKRNEADFDWCVRKFDKPKGEKSSLSRVPGTAVFLTSDIDSAPPSLLHNIKHNKVLHERNVMLNIRTTDSPRVARHERITVEKTGDSFYRVVARYGFMETPSVPKILELCRRKDLNIDLGQTSFFLSRRSLKATDKSELPILQERVFIWMSGNAADATAYFRIPPDRVVEVGTQVLI